METIGTAVTAELEAARVRANLAAHSAHADAATLAGRIARVGVLDAPEDDTAADEQDRYGAYCATCGEHIYPGADGRRRCFNIGACTHADAQASAQSLRRGAASSAPAAWTLGGRVD